MVIVLFEDQDNTDFQGLCQCHDRVDTLLTLPVTAPTCCHVTQPRLPQCKLRGYIFVVVVWSTANGVIVVALQNNWHHKLVITEPACCLIDVL